MPRPIRTRDPAPSSTLTRQAVLVTGGAGGIGRAICLAFGETGWQVGVHCRTRLTEAEQTAGNVKDAGGDGFALQADIRDHAQVAAMFDRFMARCGRLDALICNAGETVSSLVLRLNPEEWQAVIETNLTGTFHCLRASAAILLKQRQGSVVIVGSYAGYQGRAGQAAYAASKAGLLGLMRTAAQEWGPVNVRINAVFPGWHRTDLSREAMSDETQLTDHVLRHTADLTEVGRTIVHLATLSGVSGQVWNLDSRIVI